MKLRKYFWLAAILVGLISCATYRYEYIAPATESGKMCAMQCMNTKNVCYSAAQSQSQVSLNNCQQQNQINYQACMSRAHNQDEAKKCNPRGMYCSTTVNYRQCDESYRQCFITCGGTVNAFKVE
jgi:hypothetical protein